MWIKRPYELKWVNWIQRNVFQFPFPFFEDKRFYNRVEEGRGCPRTSLQTALHNYTWLDHWKVSFLAVNFESSWYLNMKTDISQALCIALTSFFFLSTVVSPTEGKILLYLICVCCISVHIPSVLLALFSTLIFFYSSFPFSSSPTVRASLSDWLSFFFFRNDHHCSYTERLIDCDRSIDWLSQSYSVLLLISIWFLPFPLHLIVS